MRLMSMRYRIMLKVKVPMTKTLTEVCTESPNLSKNFE